MNDTLRTWAQPVSQPALPLRDMMSKTQINDNKRSQSFSSLSSSGQLAQTARDIQVATSSSFSSRRMSSTSSSSTQPSYTHIEPPPRRSLTTVDHTLPVPGVPAEMLSVFGLDPVHPQPAATAALTRRNAPLDTKTTTETPTPVAMQQPSQFLPGKLHNQVTETEQNSAEHNLPQGPK
ncbi:uncharacterized protein B0I36DRAFT_126386 [Microdochium trichocladiopsis]|uniref:Uncharacterized protein n=1 Tax=Microdochium trichocladiopsis TaxID=1682393 RepID=A0A9P9BLQ0_9PEZI|nr:uncharacterized protein B0I36DRAFT_126386 [Microdochium trichocladiopsis]KAH7028823.1 hypothetical protein B0I36DRAFT_126386 [Microdochium trichocladiopsis]